MENRLWVPAPPPLSKAAVTPQRAKLIQTSKATNTRTDKYPNRQIPEPAKTHAAATGACRDILALRNIIKQANQAIYFECAVRCRASTNCFPTREGKLP